MPPDEPKAAWQLAVERNLQVARDRASGIEREAPSRDRRIERGGQGRGVQGAAEGKEGEPQRPLCGSAVPLLAREIRDSSDRGNATLLLLLLYSCYRS